MNGTKKNSNREPSLLEIKFIIIPRFLAAVLHLMIMLFTLQICIVSVLKNPLSPMTPICALVLVGVYVASKMTQGYIGVFLIRRRVWLWGRHRFSTWPELRKWFHEKSPQEVEMILMAEEVANNKHRALMENLKP